MILFKQHYNFCASIALRYNKRSAISYCEGENTFYSRRLKKWLQRQKDDPYLYNAMINKLGRSIMSRINERLR